jgi:hypothetical protein
MTAPKRLSLPQLREIVSDAGELAKGTQLADSGGLSHLSRFELKLFADAAGSGSAPYKVQIVFDENGAAKGRCSCMAARSRPFCKHAAALLVSWARAPDSFAVAETAPVPLAGDAKKREVKKGKVDSKDLMARGVDQAATLVRELAVAGVRALAVDRVEQVRALGEALREAKLRRVSARTLELARHLQAAALRSESFDALEYAEILGDMLLTVRKLEKHLQGEALAEEHVEELIGKTWTKKDRKPIAGLELVEYAFASRTTPDGFLIRESRFLDLGSGEHYSEKQILPGFLVKRTEAKRSWAGHLLAAIDASVYPSYAPRRLDIEGAGALSALDQGALTRLLEAALPDVGAALAAFQERRKDVFAPEGLPVALRADSLFAHGGRMQVLDAGGAALFLPEDPELEARLAGTLMDATLLALFGDVVLDGALPTLAPLAALVRAQGELQLVGLGGFDAATLLASRKLRLEAVAAARAPVTRWVDVARRTGVPPAAVVLGEVREEMAEALAQGLSAVNSRAAAAWVSRLSDLGLSKQAGLLQELAQRAAAESRLDDFVKLHQVLGIALSRLAAAAAVDLASLEPVPTAESVKVRRPERLLALEEVTAALGAGRLSRYEAALHRARHIEAMEPQALEATAATLWADGSLTPFIARALAHHPDAAVAAARRILTPDTRISRWRRPTARVATLTAIRVLQAAGTAAARAELRGLLGGIFHRAHSDIALTEHARRALRVLDRTGEPPERRKRMDELAAEALNAASKDDRVAALRQLAGEAHVEAIPAMRTSFAGDISGDVREEAAYALARIGDIDSVERFVRMLRARETQPAQAKVAARALGELGDLRGVHELLAAWAEGWHPAIVAEALRQVGSAVLEPLVTLLEANPALAQRKAALGVVSVLPVEDVEQFLLARLDAAAGTAAFVERAELYVTLAAAASDPAAMSGLALRVLELAPQVRDKKATREEKALARRCDKLLGRTEAA